MNILVFSSVFPPDPAAVGQHIADVSAGASSRGHFIRVITANRGHDDPSVLFPSYERVHGSEVVRLRWSSFGKERFISRIIGQVSLTLQGLVKGLLGIRPDVVLVSTIPPLGILAALPTARLRHSSLIYWVMDINPDEAIAVGLVRPRFLGALLMDSIHKAGLRSARTIVTLDFQMAQRLEFRARLRERPIIIPPWPLNDIIAKSGADGRAFRKEHGLGDRFILMYSGNHSWVHPLDTILEAAKSLAHRKDILFLFVGGGVEKHKVEKAIRNGARNMISLPYQSFPHLGESLAAADVHLVVMGRSMAGIVHPSKIYSAMAAGRPVLAVAPEDFSISEIMEKHEIGLRFCHGDVSGVIQGILTFADMEEKDRRRFGENARRLACGPYHQALLRGRFLNILEQAAAPTIN